MAGKKAPYQGGAWQVGGIRSQRPPVSPAVRRALVAQQYIPHCQRRIDEGFEVYRGILQEYRRELLALSVQMAQERATARRAAAAQTPRKAA